MIFTFEPLEKFHFPLLLKWLESPHVKPLWDPDITWTPKLIEEKYGSYVKGFKKIILAEEIIEKPIYAFVISLNSNKIGYIQYYNIYDFPREDGQVIDDLPPNLGAIDIFIGEKSLIGEGIGIGPLVLEIFLKNYVFQQFDAAFVGPESNNKNAIRAYEKVGFVTLKQTKNGTINCMIKKKN